MNAGLKNTALEIVRPELEADRAQIEIFVEALFRYASEGTVSLRAFFENDAAPFQIVPVPVSVGLLGIIDAAEKMANHAANAPNPVVFCPILCTFREGRRAKETDVVEGLVLSVECDTRPQEARAKLEQLLGPATIAVRSGGLWADSETGLQHDKMHLHWRLVEPACGSEELAKLKRARDLAARIIGGDPSGKPVVHPYRWPGSWHRKGTPRMCAIEAHNTDNEIEIGTALDVLIDAAPPEATNKGADGNDRPAPLEWEIAVRAILSGGSYHPTLTSLSASFASRGIPAEAADSLLRCLMLNSKPEDLERERRRSAELYKLPQTIASAYQKYGEKSEAENKAGMGEWDAGEDPGPIPPREWLLGNQFCRSFVSSIVAAGGVGKSALRLVQFISLSTGRALSGQHVFRRCRVLLVSLEDDTRELHRRIKAVLIHFGIPRSELKGWLFCAAPKLAKLAELKNKIRVIGPLERMIREATEKHKPDLISLDPFIKTHALEENASGDMDFVCDLLVRLGVEFNIAVDSPHHVHKGTVTPGDADAGRGSGSIRDSGRLVYTLVPMSEEEARAFGIPIADRRDYVRLDSAKVNITRNSLGATWFRLVGVPIDNGTPEYPNGDVIQVVEPWTPPETWAGLSSEALNAALDQIARGNEQGQRYSAGRSAGKERAAWCVVQKNCPAKTEAQCREIVRVWVETGLLYSAEYKDPVQRRPLDGLYVEDAKRPS